MKRGKRRPAEPAGFAGKANDMRHHTSPSHDTSIQGLDCGCGMRRARDRSTLLARLFPISHNPAEALHGAPSLSADNFNCVASAQHTSHLLHGEYRQIDRWSSCGHDYIHIDCLSDCHPTSLRVRTYVGRVYIHWTPTKIMIMRLVSEQPPRG